MYHKVAPDSPTKWWVTVDQFYRQLCELQAYQVVCLDDYDCSNPMHVAITFDGIYQNVVDYAGPLLHRFGYVFELFLSGDHIGRDNQFDAVEPAARFADTVGLKKLVGYGGRLQWHTRSHPKLTQVQSGQELDLELTVPDELRAIDRRGFNWFAYPHGLCDQRVEDAARKYFSGAVACDNGNMGNRYLLPRLTVENSTTFLKNSVGVVVPCYNYGHFLPEAMESLLRQTRLPQRILIADDCSSDNSREVGQYYQQKHAELVAYHRNPQNLGIVPNFNKAVSMLNTDYVCFLGADNRFRADYIEQSTGALDRDSSLAVAYTDFALFGPLAESEYQNFTPQFRGEIKESHYFVINFPEFSEYGLDNLRKKNIIHGSCMFRRVAFEQVGGYLESSQAEDHNLFVRMLAQGWSAKRIARPLLEYRKHSMSQANARLVSQAELNLYREIVQDQNKRIAALEAQLLSRVSPTALVLGLLRLPFALVRALLPQSIKLRGRKLIKSFLIACERCDHPIFELRKLVPQALRAKVGKMVWKIQKAYFP